MNLNNGLMDNTFTLMKEEYLKNGCTTWDEYHLSPENNSEKNIKLYNKDLLDGTLRITKPCLITLQENIYFNPNRPETWLDKDDEITSNTTQAKKLDPNRVLDWMPSQTKESNKQYFEKDVRFGYTLGFFAAIAVECDNVIIDLNGFTIEQHEEHALQQRFFAVIELADQPFIPKQGPANFGKNLRSANRLMIMNGTIGNSSHHGIHGNSARYIYFKDLVFSNFEVAAVSLNGCRNVSFENVTVDGNNTNIKVLGTYSAARFIKLFCQMIMPAIILPDSYQDVYDKFIEEADSVFNNHILKNGLGSELYDNKSGLIDGNAYGILIHPSGVAVGELLANRSNSSANQTTQYYMNNVHINNIKGKINEILGLQDSNKKMLTDPSGSIFQFFNGIAKQQGNKYYYQGTTLSDMQLELIRIVKLNPEIKSHLGNLNLPESLLKWKDNSDFFFELNDGYLIGTDESKFKVIGNGDSMFHVNKGMFGMRIDGLNKGYFNNVTISNTSNTGVKGSELAGNYLMSHPGQKSMKGYHGHHTYGIVFCAVNDVEVNQMFIDNVTSENGSAFGLAIANESSNLVGNKIQVRNVTCCQQPYDYVSYVWPNPPTIARGLKVFRNIEFVSLNGLIIKSINNSPNSLSDQDVEINSIINIKN